MLHTFLFILFIQPQLILVKSLEYWFGDCFDILYYIVALRANDFNIKIMIMSTKTVKKLKSSTSNVGSNHEVKAFINKNNKNFFGNIITNKQLDKWQNKILFHSYGISLIRCFHIKTNRNHSSHALFCWNIYNSSFPSRWLSWHLNFVLFQILQKYLF